MMPAPNHNPDRPDPLAGYIEGARDAVEAARPDEPGEDRWDAVLAGVRARLAPAPVAPRSTRWRWKALAAGGVALAAAAAAVAWVAFAPVAVNDDVVRWRPVAPVLEAKADPLAAFDVLPMASAEEVDLHRVPGAGWLPVGTDPLPDVLILATTKEVELEDPDPTWPKMVSAPGDAPMIFAVKPR